MANIPGTPGNDNLTGTDFNDVIRGLAGNDFILRLAGDDRIEGGSDNDNLQGGNGNDRIEGGNDNDTLFGGIGNDLLQGDGSEFENFFGEDKIFAGEGNDTLEGGAGNDQLFGEVGNDKVTGGGGSDTLEGGTGNDVLLGDDLRNSSGDRLIGVDDLRFIVRPGQGEIDKLTGGPGVAGHDVFVLGDANRVYYNDGIANNSGRSDFAVITDFTDGQDAIQLKGGVTYGFSSVSNLSGGVSGVGVFATIDGGSELIGVVQGVTVGQLQLTNGPTGGLTTVS